MSQPQSAKILLAEDLEEDRRLLADFLMDKGYTLYLAMDGIEAIEIARKVLPDLILMDVHMPLCDGHAAVLRMRSIAALAETPVIFLTAAAEPWQRVAGLQMGAVDYITKPYDLAEVALRLDVHLQYLQASRALQGLQPVHGGLPGEADASPEKLLFHTATASMQVRMGSDLTLEDLARDVGVNPRRLNAVFQQYSQMSAAGYWRTLRLQQAGRLLRGTALEVAEVARQVGFRTPAGFATAFREHHGMTPSDYRKRSGL